MSPAFKSFLCTWHAGYCLTHISKEDVRHGQVGEVAVHQATFEGFPPTDPSLEHGFPGDFCLERSQLWRNSTEVVAAIDDLEVCLGVRC